MKTYNILEQLEYRLKSREYDLFPATKSRLLKIKKKMEDKELLTRNDITTLANEGYRFGINH